MNAESKLSQHVDWEWSGMKHIAGAGILEKGERLWRSVNHPHKQGEWSREVKGKPGKQGAMDVKRGDYSSQMQFIILMNSGQR